MKRALFIYSVMGFMWISHVSLHYAGSGQPPAPQGYVRSVFDALPKGKPYRTKDARELKRLYANYSEMNRDLPEDWEKARKK